MTPRIRIENDLVNVLASMPLMEHPETRPLFVRQLRHRLDHRVDLRDFAEPRSQSVEIVGACAGVPVGLGAMAEVAALLAPEARQIPQLQRLLHEWDVVDALAEEDWSELAPALRGRAPQNPGWLYQRATNHRLASPPGWCEDAWDMFVHLSGQNAPASGLPPGMHFLLLLEYEVDADVAGVLYRRNLRVATTLDLTADFDRRRAALNLSTDQVAEPYLYLVIQIEPEQEPDQPAERYVVSQYRQWHGGGSWHSRPHGPRVPGVAQDGLEAVAEQMVREAEQDWSYPGGSMVIEFVLPIQLLNADVAWWRKEPGRLRTMSPKLLSFDHPVVVRSLERLREKGWHHAWRQRWHRLRSDPANSRLYRGRSSWADFTQLEAELNLDPSWTAMLLSEPPRVDGSGKDAGVLEVMTALRAGLPIIVWHRTDSTSDALWQEIYDMTADGQLAQLPARAQQVRLAALRLPPKRRPRHLGWHLAVLWDDPDRMPELGQAAQSPGGAGA